jgi:hypothetical protein
VTDLDVSRAFDELEQLLARSAENPDPEAVAAWHATFKAALASAERGPDWPALKARGRAMEVKLNQTVGVLRGLQDAVKREIDGLGAGRRALSAYNPSRN